MLSLDNSWNHHMVLWADGEWILVATARKGLDIFSHVREGDDLIHEASVGTIDRSGIIMVLLCQLVHLVDDRSEGSICILLLNQSPGK